VQYGHLQRNLDQRISQGENLLGPASSAAKLAGIAAARQGDWPQAARQFQQALQRQPLDPETRIYWNNAQIGTSLAINIGVSVPLGSNPDVAQEILLGVAQAQQEFNQRLAASHPQLRLRLQIANDDNSPEIAKAIAQRWVDNPQILGVIGHNASDASVAAAPIYQQGRVVMITPTSFSNLLSPQDEYIFRMVVSIQFLTEALAQQYIHLRPQARIALCSDAKAVDNETFRNQFALYVAKQALTYRQVALVDVPCNFADPNFNATTTVNQLLAARANTVLLAPHVDRVAKALDLARANQGRLQLLGSPTLYTRATFQAGALTQGMILVSPWYPQMLPRHAFLGNAIRLWGQPAEITWRTAMSYDTTALVGFGVERALRSNRTAGQPSRATLQAALRRAQMPGGASGKIQFTGSGERQIFEGFGATLLQMQPKPTARYGYDLVPLPVSTSPEKADLRK
jgi:branched-chain amino acid transport system substrate-binding protein